MSQCVKQGTEQSAQWQRDAVGAAELSVCARLMETPPTLKLGERQSCREPVPAGRPASPMGWRRCSYRAVV